MGGNVIAEGLNFKVRDEASRDAILLDQVVTHNAYHFPKDMPGKVVLDVGGHIGAVALMCAKRGATVYTFEPERESYQLLLENLAQNETIGSVIPFNLAVGKWGLHKLYKGNKERGVASFYPELNPALTENYEMVVSVSLQFVLSLIGEIDYLKLDCEGSEKDIIKDIIETNLSVSIPKFVVEFHEDEVAIRNWLLMLGELYHVTPLSHIEYSFQRR